VTLHNVVFTHTHNHIPWILKFEMTTTWVWKKSQRCKKYR